jgi:hypothetical protein
VARGGRAALWGPLVEAVVPESPILGLVTLGVASGLRQRKHSDQCPAR